MLSNVHLERLRRAFPEFTRDYTPSWGLPSLTYLSSLERRLHTVFPSSYVAFHAEYASVLPPPSQTLFWPRLDRVAGFTSVSAGVKSARAFGVPSSLVPFAGDEGNFVCFNTAVETEPGEYPVAFWDHDERSVVQASHLMWRHFPAWLESEYLRQREGRAT